MNLSEAFEDACSRFTGSNFASLSARDQVLVTIWGLEADVNNGGFNQYYFNGSGDQAWFAPTALRRIGAHQMAAIAERANASFGEAGPPRDADERQSALFRITDASEGAWDQLDQEFYAYPDDIAALLVAHFGLAASA
jgi:uncharacterized protein DUF4375